MIAHDTLEKEHDLFIKASVHKLGNAFLSKYIKQILWNWCFNPYFKFFDNIQNGLVIPDFYMRRLQVRDVRVVQVVSSRARISSTSA